jgi:predicted  nucleic acid-binding Zn-ribbon protein
VKEQLQLLIELQGIDSAIVKKRESVDALPKKLNLFMKTLDDAQSVYEKLRKRFADLEKMKREKERVLDEIQEKIRKLKTRISEIKTNKEYQTHLKEIESTDKEKNLIEDEILSVMESLETMQKGLESEHRKVKAEREEGEALKDKLLKDTAAAERELEDLKQKRVERIGNIPKDLYIQIGRAHV